MNVFRAWLLAGVCLVAAIASSTSVAQQVELPAGLGQPARPTISNRNAAELAREVEMDEKARQRKLASEEMLKEKRLAAEKAARERALGAQEVNPDNRPVDETRNEFQELVAVSVGRTLPMFGHILFDSSVPSTFAPIDQIPVTPDYVIGPGDEILIRGWGQVDIDYRVQVDRNGAIHIPQIGSLTVGGLRYQDLHGFLRSAISRVFRNFELSVNLGQLRSMQVFVVGNARYPGVYTVSSLSTLVNALFASGGPTTRGSMRRIELKRGGSTVTEFDLYDLILKGDKSKDVRLMPGDVLYIPPVGELVAIAGSVNQQAIYELREGTSVGDLIRLAGGLSTVAAGQSAKIERLVDRRGRVVDEIDLNQAGLAKPVRDGDFVQIYALSPRFENAVALRGFVYNPGRFPWREGMRVRDVIPSRDALISPDYWQRLNRATRAGFRPDPMLPRASEQRSTDRSTDLQASALAAGMEMPRSAGPQKPTEPQRLGDPRTSDSQGEPPRTEMRRLFDEVNWEYAAIERLDPVELTTMIIPFNLRRAVIDGDPTQNLALRPGDVVTVFSRLDIPVPVAKQAQFVRLEGEVRTPGVYQLLTGETLRQLVMRVGGFTPQAYLYGAELTRESVRVQQQKRLDDAIERMSQEVERGAASRAQAALGDEKESIQAQADTQRRLIERMRGIKATGRIVIEVTPERTDLRDLPELVLQDGDRFYIPSRPSTVAVLGSVYNQTAFVYDRAKRLPDYLDLAGGYTRGADKRRTYIVRADGTITGRAQSSFLNPFQGERMNPGDTIVVPEDFERFFLTKELRDWTQILSQFALGVAAFKVLKDF